MAVVESMTLARQLALEASTVVGGSINGSGHLILTRHDGTTIDAGNALVAVPDKEVLDFLDPNSYTETTPPSGYPDGESLLYLDPTHTTASWPSAFSAKRVVIRSTRDATNGSGDVAQVALRLVNNTFTMEQYIRSSRSDVWTPWVRVITTADVPSIVSTLAAPAESADYTAYPSGVSITNVGSGSGWSIGGGFGNIVTVNQTNNRVFQLFISSAGGSSGNVSTWTRTYHTPEGWTPWFQTATPQDPSTMGITGEIKIWSSSTIPNGWSLCDGGTLNRTGTGAALFAVIGTTYGAGDGSTTFNKPDLKGRVPVGFDGSQTEFDTMGETGGEKTHVLTQTEMPSHTHVQNAHNHNFPGNGALTDGPTGVSYGVTNGTFYGFNATSTNNTTATNQNTGGGAAHNNLQPYVVLRYIIKL